MRTTTRRKAQKTTTETPNTDDLRCIKRMFNAVRDTLCNLQSRWQNERDYEDINEYADVLRKLMPKGIGLEHMTKSPFGFVFSVGTVKYAMTANNRQVGVLKLAA